MARALRRVSEGFDLLDIPEPFPPGALEAQCLSERFTRRHRTTITYLKEYG